MILLLSEERDISTDNVVEWLHYYNAEFVRINTTQSNLIRSLRIDQSGTSILFENDYVNVSDIDSIWFRRGSFRFISEFFKYSEKSEDVNSQILRQVYSDTQVFSYYLYQALSENAYTINHPAKYNLNKLMVLDIAKRCGLTTPDTIVTKSKEELERFQKVTSKKLITKQLSDNLWIQDGKTSYGVGTRPIHEISDNFFYSLFQTGIDRLCELRIFYLDKQFFPAAIFVDDDLPDARSLVLGNSRARIVPFVLPEVLIKALSNLTEIVGVNCGSIDMILDKNGAFYFLEINPVGQYDYIEIACNYPISKLIAETLCKRKSNTSQ